MTEQKYYRPLDDAQIKRDDPRNVGDLKITKLSVGEDGSEVELTATPTELNQLHGSVITELTPTAPGAGISGGTGTVCDITVVKTGNIIKTDIYLNLTGLTSKNTDHDVIGTGTAAAYITKITTAVNGAIFAGEIKCKVVPTTGDTDIDLYSSTAATGKYDDAAGGLAGSVALTNIGASHAIGTTRNLTALPAADTYLYLASTSVAGVYDAGILVITLYGYAG